jgi:hypothetical protein
VTFTANGQRLLLSPHNWVSHGLAGQPFLPIDQRASTLYSVDIAGGAVEPLRLPDAISSVAVGGDDRIAVGCWNHRVYLFDGRLRPITGLPEGVDVGAASLVRFARNGQRLLVATAAGVALTLDSEGRILWRTDLNQAVQPGDKPWTQHQQAGAPLAPGVWWTNGGLAHSDMGSQLVVQAPQGLLLVDPNAGASFEQNWAKIEAAGLDPRQVKYVLLTHEHGDHAPGAYLWRVITGAQVVAGAEAAYLLQHHIPGGTGYGFHPPQPVDIAVTQDTELELAGLKVRCLRLPGHTYGSMGYAFARVADWNGDGTADLFLQQSDKENGVRILFGAANGGLAADRQTAVRLDYAPHFDTRIGVVDFNGDGFPDVAGFGTAKTGATGVYLWLQTGETPGMTTGKSNLSLPLPAPPAARRN